MQNLVLHPDESTVDPQTSGFVYTIGSSRSEGLQSTRGCKTTGVLSYLEHFLSLGGQKWILDPGV